jgi:hypothetical protein
MLLLGQDRALGGFAATALPKPENLTNHEWSLLPFRFECHVISTSRANRCSSA